MKKMMMLAKKPRRKMKNIKRWAKFPLVRQQNRMMNSTEKTKQTQEEIAPNLIGKYKGLAVVVEMRLKA